jgi:poly-gamma-glutamate synthesis protein (capsule biosynthesis protein)
MHMRPLSIVVACGLAAVTAAAAPPARPPARPGTLSVAFVGDIMLDGGPGHAIGSGRDPFAGCADLLAAADLTVGNLECVLGKGGKQILKAYSFRAAADAPRCLARHFSAVSLANNHAYDFGPEGLLESLRILEAEKIPCFGAGGNDAAARRPLVLEKNGIRLALLGANAFRADAYAAGPDRAGVAPLREREILADIAAARQVADVVVPFVHWGPELVAQPREADIALAHAMVEAGAAAVIGAHPHVTQTVDIHRGAPIVYSLGNFVFDYFPGDPAEWTGWIVTLTFTKGRGVEMATRAVVLDAEGLPRPAVE